MIKKEIYPKTKRVSCSGEKVEITEKLDGSNLCIFVKNGILHFAQRNNIFDYSEILTCENSYYKGLRQWIIDNRAELATIREGSVVCGEWLGMGKLKYDVGEFDKRFYMFAKANIDDDYNLYNIYYNHDLFIYPFNTNEIPKCIGVVPMVYEIEYIPDKDKLDVLYSKYCEKTKRDVEGFVINWNNNIKKYVRMKNGKLQEHFDRGE